MTDPTPISRADATTRLSRRIRAAIKPGSHWFPLALFTAALAVGLLVTVLVLTLRTHKATFFNVQPPAATEQGAVLPTPEITGVSALPPPSAAPASSDAASIAPAPVAAPVVSAPMAADPLAASSVRTLPQTGNADNYPSTADTPVRIVQRTQLVYPRDALRDGEQGAVQLQIEVSADGVVDDVNVIGRSGSRSLDRAAADAVRDWQFQPATHAGIPVPGTLELPINFTLDGR